MCSIFIIHGSLLIYWRGHVQRSNRLLIYRLINNDNNILYLYNKNPKYKLCSVVLITVKYYKEINIIKVQAKHMCTYI